MSREQAVRQHVERMRRVLSYLIQEALADGATGPETTEDGSEFDELVLDVKRAVDRYQAHRPRVASRA
jgi:hypothetical protein